jgi:hypothetical protein
VVEAIFGKEEALASSASVFPLRASMTTSPPAQKPRPSRWSTMTASMFESSRHFSSASLITSHMLVVSAWIAFERLSRRRPTRWSTVMRTSSSVIGGACRG